MSPTTSNAPASRSHSKSTARSSRSKSTSPIRKPLHERSASQNNEFSGPTIRIVHDSDAAVYSKSPFPTRPSQVLIPSRGSAYAFEERQPRVSLPTPSSKALASQHQQPRQIEALRKANRASTSTNASDADTLVNNSSTFSPTSSRFSTSTTPPSSPPHFDDSGIGGISGLGGLEDIPKLVPKPAGRLTIRAVVPSSSAPEPRLASTALQTATASASSSSETLTAVPKQQEEQTNGVVFTLNPTPPLDFAPLPNSSARRSPLPSSRGKKRASSTTTRPPTSSSESSTSTAIITIHSPNSIRSASEAVHASSFSDRPVSRPRSASHPSAPSTASSDGILHATIESAIRVQFPIVRQPSATSLLADSTVSSEQPSRMNDRGLKQHQWSSPLSPIQSESERNSASLPSRRHTPSYEEPRLYRMVSAEDLKSVPTSSSGDSHFEQTEVSIAIPPPLFSPKRPVESRDSDEMDDVVAPLQSPPLRPQRSGYLNRRPSDPRPSSSQSDIVNYISNSIPGWARVYYRNSSRTSLSGGESVTDVSDSRLNTATSGQTNSPVEGFFPTLWRPRNRPRESEALTSSMGISPEPVQEAYIVGPPRNHVSEPFTPRLRLDKRSTARLSAWRAPSFDENVGTLIFSRGNRQILMFCLGFLLPISWMIASFLPLPDRGALSEKATPSQLDVEQVMSRELDFIDERRYQKAKWWRTLNRVMSVVGVLLIAAIIALAVVASQMARLKR